MSFSSGRLIVAAGVVLTVAGLLTFSLAAPTTTVGQETDVGPETEVIEIITEDPTPAVGADVGVLVVIVDEAGVPLAGVPCQFVITSQPGNDASIAGGLVTTDADGVATATLHVGSTPGSITVEAHCENLVAVVSVVAGASEGAETDDEEAALPPASLPDTGNGGYLEAAGSPRVLLMALLTALGLTLAGAGMVVARKPRRVQDGE